MDAENAVPPTEAVLEDLSQAAAHYREVLATAERQATALQDAEAQVRHLQTQLVGAQEVNSQLVVRLQESEQKTEQERAKVRAQNDLLGTQDAQIAAQRARNQRLEEILNNIHKTLFSGDVYALILKACLTITEASRGVYVTRRGEQGAMQIRAAIDVDDYPQSPPSEFLQALCQRVLQDGETLVAHSAADLADLPAPQKATERFHNCIVAPVSLLKDMNGIVVCVDKLHEDFSDDDVRSVLAVGNQAVVAAENAQLRRHLQEAYLSTVSVMADAMQAKDAATQGHSEIVARYAQLIARHLNLSERERSIISYAALLHDIGKIGVSDGLLNKPGPLLPEERELVRAHVRIGHDLIQNVPALRLVANAVLHHHECYDGTGYPQGLKGEEIPVASRVVCVVDAYSAIITRRSYKDAYSDEWARKELKRCAGTQFDPRVVDAFLYVLGLPNLDTLNTDEESEWEWLPDFALTERERSQ